MRMTPDCEALHDPAIAPAATTVRCSPPRSPSPKRPLRLLVPPRAAASIPTALFKPSAVHSTIRTASRPSPPHHVASVLAGRALPVASVTSTSRRTTSLGKRSITLLALSTFSNTSHQRHNSGVAPLAPVNSAPHRTPSHTAMEAAGVAAFTPVEFRTTSHQQREPGCRSPPSTPHHNAPASHPR